MRTKKIIIEEYSPNWATIFQELRGIYLTHLGDLLTDVQHVGSTAVPGLAAKPIIDIDLIIENKENLGRVIEQLRLLGYDHLGDLGISEREAFKPRSNHVPFVDSSRIWPRHHLYVCPAESDSLKNHIAFRDFLRNDPNAARAYADLKKRLVLQDPYDIDGYVARKTPFIIDTLRKAGFDIHSLNKINQNNSIGNLKNNH